MNNPFFVITLGDVIGLSILGITGVVCLVFWVATLIKKMIK